MTKAAPDTTAIKIVDFKSKYRSHFRALNYEWLEACFHVEPYDRIVLNDPEKHIIKAGGQVLMALLDRQVVGTVALLKHAPHKFELAKMAVTKSARGKKVGRTLGEAAIQRARALGATDLVLATSPLLKTANRLYERLGFVKVDPIEIGPLPYQRHSIVMGMKL